MQIVRPRHRFRAAIQCRRATFLSSAVCVASPFFLAAAASADPTLPTIGATVYNVTLPNGGVSGASIDGGAVAVANGTTDNRTVLNAFISYAASHGGGTVEIPAAASDYASNIITIRNGVNLQLDAGATLEDLTPANTLITTSGSPHDIEISGGGVIEGNATTVGNSALVNLNDISRLELTGVTIQDAALQHLVTENDTNVTMNGITIQDPAGTQKNGDGIDYSGSHFLIENSSVSDGDDNIVAKPQSTFTSDITIENDYIGYGHGISIGGQTNAGLNGMTVNNITFNGTNNGFRLKAGRGNGGLVQNLVFNNVTMTNVANPIFISSWYNNGTDQYPADPRTTPNVTFNAVTTPQWQNITFANISSTDLQGGSANPGIIYGLPEAPIENLQLDNVSLMSNRKMQINFAGYTGVFNPTPDPNYEVQFNEVTVDGTLLTSQNDLLNGNLFNQLSQQGLFDTDIVISAPEPASMVIMGMGGMLLLRRKRKPAPTV
jgi:polygalacturonase